VFLANSEAKYFLAKGWTMAKPEARLICPSGKSPHGLARKQALEFAALWHFLIQPTARESRMVRGANTP
jgi:hypothetical protein